MQILQILYDSSLMLIFSKAPFFHSPIVFLDRAMAVGYLDYPSKKEFRYKKTQRSYWYPYRSLQRPLQQLQVV